MYNPSSEPQPIPSMQMPRYSCHKEVWALKIKEVRSSVTDFDFFIVPEEEGYAPVEVTREYAEKFRPQVGGYYVVYEDGYKSYSPAKAFEEGYTLIK